MGQVARFEAAKRAIAALSENKQDKLDTYITL